MTIDMWFDSLSEALWRYGYLGGVLKKVGEEYLLVYEEA